jgi:hypothetical protein
MAAKYSVETEITGRGNLAEVVKRGTAALRGMLGPIKAVNEAVQKPDATALGRVGGMADHVAGRFRSGLGSITAWLPALGAIGATASLAGLVSMTRKAADGYDGFVTTAEKLGATTAQLSVLRYGWKLNNVEIEQGEKGLGKLNRTLYDAATGKNKDAAALFQRLGINLRDANGQVRKGVDVMPQLMQAFEKNENASLRSAMAVALFGKSGESLIPFLIRGKAYLAELTEENRRYSSLTKEQAAGMGELDAAYDKLEKAGSGLTLRLSVAMAPALGRVVNLTTDWIVANRELIGQAVDRKVATLEGVVTSAAGAVKAFIDLPFVSWMFEGANAGTAIEASIGLLGLTMAGPLFSALGVVTKGIWAMNVALYANPWVLLIGAVAAAAYAIYANWGPITEWFGEQMDAVNSAFDQGFCSGLVELFSRFNPFNLVQNAVNGLSKWLFGVDLFDAGAKLLRRLIDGIKSLLPSFDTVWAPVDRALKWAGDRVSAGSAALNADTASGGNMPGDFNPAMFGAPPTPSSTGGVAAQRSAVSIAMDFRNVPPGTKIDTSTTGPAKLETNVGYSMSRAE